MPVAPRAIHKVHMEVMPLFAGYLPFPDVRLFKYLPHHSAHSMQLDAGKAILTTWLLTEITQLFLCSCVKRKARQEIHGQYMDLVIYGPGAHRCLCYLHSQS